MTDILKHSINILLLSIQKLAFIKQLQQV